MPSTGDDYAVRLLFEYYPFDSKSLGYPFRMELYFFMGAAAFKGILFITLVLFFIVFLVFYCLDSEESSMENDSIYFNCYFLDLLSNDILLLILYSAINFSFSLFSSSTTEESA